jgi:hypothetical protein
LTSPNDQYETLCFGTGLGYLVVWRQDEGGRFAEILAKRLGQGREILGIAMDTPMKDHVRFAVGTRCGSIQLWKYDHNGMVNLLKAVAVGETIPRNVAFASNDNTLRVFGFYDGYMYVQAVVFNFNRSDKYDQSRY